MKIRSLSFPTFGLTCSVCDIVDPCNCVGSPTPGSMISSYPIPTLLKPAVLFLINSVWMSRDVQWSVDFGLCLLAPLFHRNGLQLVHLWTVQSIGVAWCSSNYAQVPSAARLTICIYWARRKQYMPYYDVANVVTVTKMHMIRRNALWLCKNLCCENTASRLLLCYTAVSAAHEVSHRAARNVILC